jgi:hypothetical protein
LLIRAFWLRSGALEMTDSRQQTVRTLKPTMMIIAVLAALVTCVAGAIFYGAARWQRRIRELHTNLEAARLPIQPMIYDPQEIEALPPPVRRYFRTVLTDGHPIIAVARFSHEGQFNMGETKEKWNQFESTQVATTRRPGFVWDGRIFMAPGVKAFVHDAYVAGEGSLHAELLGLVTVADLRGTPEVAQGELLRYLAEAAWYPTALLPSQGVCWEAMDDSRARATLCDGVTTVSLEYRFGSEGLIDTARAAARYRTVNGALEATPWEGRFWAYAVRNGIRIPLEGEVAWQLPTGPSPYWRGRITEIAYEFAS